MRRLTRRMRPRGHEGRYQHAIVRRGGHRRRRREGTDGAAAGDGAGFRHCCCRFRATKNGPVMCHVIIMSSWRFVRSRVLGRRKAPRTYESRFELSSSSQSRNNGKLDGLPNTSCVWASVSSRRCFAIGIPPLRAHRHNTLHPSSLTRLVYHHRTPSYKEKGC